jgi:hypothetical protein
MDNNDTSFWMSTSSMEPSQSPTLSNTYPPSSLTVAQDQALSLTPVFTGLLSAWGSVTIIYMVLTSSKRSCYKRIMLGLSVFDLMSSLTIALQPFLLPSDSQPPRVWAVGNDASCNAMGFFHQFSQAAVWYTGFLSVFFLLTIRFDFSEETMAKCMEPLFHVWSIGYPLVTGIVGLVLGAYGVLGLGHACWLASEFEMFLILLSVGRVTSLCLVPCVPIISFSDDCHLSTNVLFGVKTFMDLDSNEQTNEPTNPTPLTDRLSRWLREMSRWPIATRSRVLHYTNASLRLCRPTHFCGTGGGHSEQLDHLLPFETSRWRSHNFDRKEPGRSCLH